MRRESESESEKWGLRERERERERWGAAGDGLDTVTWGVGPT